MLVLARQLHERILIPVIDTSIEVVTARAGLVRLGIDAPSAVTVLREELCRQPRAMEKPPPRPAHGRALQRQLQTVLLGLSRLQQQARTLPLPVRTVSFETIMAEVVMLSRQVRTLLETGDGAGATG